MTFQRPLDSSVRKGIQPRCPSTSWCVPRFASDELARVVARTARLPPKGISGSDAPRRPRRGSIHDSTPVFTPSNHRFISIRPRIDHRADRCPNTHARQHRRRAEGSSPTSPTSGEIAATGTMIGSRNTSTRCVSTNPRTLPSLLMSIHREPTLPDTHPDITHPPTH